MNHQAEITLERGLTIEEFLAFVEKRPKEERWELIEGVPILSPSPVDFHQIVVQNIGTTLTIHKLETGATWFAFPGIGMRAPASPRSLPQPDLMVMEGAPKGLPLSDDALVLVEILSPSNRRADREWRRKFYASVPNCQHYVTVSLKRIEVTVFDRAAEWQSRVFRSLDDVIDLRTLGLELPVATIYRWTNLA